MQRILECLKTELDDLCAEATMTRLIVPNNNLDMRRKIHWPEEQLNVIPRNGAMLETTNALKKFAQIRLPREKMLSVIVQVMRNYYDLDCTISLRLLLPCPLIPIKDDMRGKARLYSMKWYYGLKVLKPHSVIHLTTA